MFNLTQYSGRPLEKAQTTIVSPQNSRQRAEDHLRPNQLIHDGQEVGRELHGDGDHEGEVELEVEIGDVPHGGVEHTADDHEENDGEQTDPSHCWGLKQIQVGVVRPE